MERSISALFVFCLSAIASRACRFFLLLIAGFMLCFSAHAIDYLVTSNLDTGIDADGFSGTIVGQLRWAITQANTATGNRVVFAAALANQTILLSKALPALVQDMTITANAFASPNVTISGANTVPIFLVFGSAGTGNPITVDFIGNANGPLNLNNGAAIGGVGGGGAEGSGGAILARALVNVNLTDVNFSNNQAVGGSGGLLGYGGGGIFGGNGGAVNGNSGGGGGGIAALGGAAGVTGVAGAPGPVIGPGADPGGNGGGGGGGGGGAGGINGGGGGGGGGDGGSGGGGGPGGGIGHFGPGVQGGAGGFGGGGGAGQTTGMGGQGGYGGGGGSSQTGAGGGGGFGGGGGAGSPGGAAGIGGGNGGSAGGGGGLGAGGAVGLVGPNGVFTVTNTQNTSFSGSSVTPGAGSGDGQPGAAMGSDLFLDRRNVEFRPAFNCTQILSGTIAGFNDTGIVQNGLGRLILQGANTYVGGTTLTSGFIQADNNSALGTGPLTFNGGTLLTNIGGTTLGNTFTVNVTGGAIGGSQNLTLNGTGTLNGTLTNTNTAITTLNNTLSGNGALVQTAGRLVLPVVNAAYTGTTTISGGILEADNNLSLGTGNLIFNGGILLTQNGAGVTLNNPFSVTGLGGTINGNSAITLTGNGTLDGTLINTNGARTTLSGILSGGGGLTQMTGTLAVSGVNTYSGITTLSGGTLAANDDSALGTSLLMFNGGILSTEFSGGVTLGNTFTVTAFNGTINGTESITITGSGSLIGTLNNTNLTTTTLSGNITGVGKVSQQVGLLILNGINNYTGGTTVSPLSTLQGNSLGVQGDIVNNGIVIFTQNMDGTYSGIMSGSGIVRKQGAGTLNVTNTNTYTGLTTVEAGRLQLTGALAGPVTVNSGASLGGTGTIGGLVTNNGLVDPGNMNAIGTLTVGSYSQGSGGTLAIEFNGAGQTDVLQVVGPAAVDGTVQFTPDPSVYFPGSVYTFVTAGGGRSGQFSNVVFTNNNLGPLKTQVIYNPNSIQLVISGFLNPQLACLTRNQSNVVRFLNGLPFEVGTDLGNLLLELSTLDPCGANGPAEQIGSTEAAATFLVVADDVSQTHLVNTRRLDVLRHFKCSKDPCEDTQENNAPTGYAAGDLARTHRLKKRIAEKRRIQEQDRVRTERYLAQQAEAKPQPKKVALLESCKMPNGGVWVRGYANKMKQNTLKNSRGFDSKNNGFMLGMDFEVSDDWFIGFSGGKIFSHLDWEGDGSRAHIDNVLSSIYTSWFDECGLYLDGSLVFGNSKYAMNRHLNFGAFNRHARSRYRGLEISPHGGAGYVVPLNESVDTEVFGTVEYIYIRRDSYTERGAGILNLAVARKEAGFLRSEAGVGLSNLIDCDSLSFLIKSKLSYVNKNPVKKARLTAGFVGFSGNFNVESYTQIKHQAAVGLGLFCQFFTSGFVSIFYDAEFGSSSIMQAGSVRLGMQF